MNTAVENNDTNITEEHPELIFNKFINRLMGATKQPNLCNKS